MVVLSHPALDHFSLIKPCKSTPFFIPEIDLSDSNAKSHIVKACEDFGFFKLVNHGVPMELMSILEEQALNFFNLPQSQKDTAESPHPLGYGSKNIGPNGDKGWIEYILLKTNPLLFSHNSLSIFRENSEIFRSALSSYVTAVRKLACELVELMTEGLGIEPRNAISRCLGDEKSDSCFRMNYYPPFPDLQSVSGRGFIGFGEHTDPQIVSVLRSNNSTGLQICLRDNTWVSVPPDHTSFFINVGDTLQVMTNGRFKSVRHKVVADGNKARISMIYFGGPPLSEKIAPLPSLLAEGEESSYKEFTWWEYKTCAYKTRLSDYRLGLFEK